MNPKPQFGGIPCKGSTTVMRGCTNTSSCQQGKLPKSTLFEFELLAKQLLKFRSIPSYLSFCNLQNVHTLCVPFWGGVFKENSSELSGTYD